MGFCDDEDYERFMVQTPQLERVPVEDGIDLIKFWFSVTQSEQLTRFTLRRVDPVKQWKLSPIDLDSLGKWDAYTAAKERMFRCTHTPRLMQNSGTDLAITLLTCGDTVNDLAPREFCISLTICAVDSSERQRQETRAVGVDALCVISLRLHRQGC